MKRYFNRVFIKNILKKLAVLIVIGTCNISCSTDSDTVNCKVTFAYFGNDIPPIGPTSDYKYEYFYQNDVVSKVEVSNINGGNNTTYTYQFGADGKPVKTIFGAGESEEEHVIYTYTSNYLKIASIRITNSMDTISRFTQKYFYIEDPIDDKIYRFNDGFFKTSYKFRNNNVYEFGYYDIVENDTVDTFRQRYFYDDMPNTFYIPRYNVAVSPEQIQAKVTSLNNIIQVDNFDFDVPFSINFTYDYDAEGRLLYYKGSTGNIVNFEHICN